MSGQSYWGNAGDSTNAYIVNPNRKRELYMQATFPTLFGKINGGRLIQHVKMEGTNDVLSVPNSSAVWEETIRFGNEIRFTQIKYAEGNATYGDTTPNAGNFQGYRHARGWINEVNSEAKPLPGRNSLKQVKEIINDPKGDLMTTLMQWVAEEMDYDATRALLLGASRGLLHSNDGALNIALYNQSAGQQRSCYNFYVPGTGLVTQSATYATYEGNVATALDSMSDLTTYGFHYSEHRKLSDMIKNKKMKPITIGGATYRAVVLQDPDLTARLSISSGTYTTLQKEANARGDKNPALYHLNPIVLDGILYIPYERLKAFRPSTSNSVPVYGPGLTEDPRTYTNSQKLCLSIVLGAGALIRGVDQAVDIKTNTAAFQKGTAIMAAYDDGWVRREEGSEDGTTALTNDGSIVMCHYDPGVEVSFGT